MSRIGKKEIPLPAGVKVRSEGDTFVVEGPKATLTTPVPKNIKIEAEDSVLRVSRVKEDKDTMALHGLTRALLSNAVTGVTAGFQKRLDVVGIGYRVEIRGQYLHLALGFSHPIEYPIPEDVDIAIEKEKKAISNYVATIAVSGSDKYRVGQVSAELKALKPPDAYKGKGIRYENEFIKLKVGKKNA